MRSTIFKILTMLAMVVLGFTSCTEVQEENLDTYGYLQFKLYKNELPEFASKSTSDGKLEYMYQAKRMMVTLNYSGVTISQSVDLNAYDAETAEYGLRSEKIKLMAGEYKVQSIKLFDESEKELFVNDYTDQTATVTVGGFTTVNLVVNSTAKGFAKFSFGKNTTGTRAENTAGLIMSNVKYVDLRLTNAATLETHTIDTLVVKYKVNIEGENLFQNGYLQSDSLCRVMAGDWYVSYYNLKSQHKTSLASGTLSANDSDSFTVKDNAVVEHKFDILIDQESAQINDYRALKKIWEALDGPNWSYVGEAFAEGANWNFECDIDQWGLQPGVALHENGRVASINISEFGFKGAMPEELGELTELYELYLGTHNDKNVGAFDPSLTIQGKAIDGTLNSERFELAKKQNEELHGTGFEKTVSPLLRRAYTLRDKTIPYGATISDNDIADAERAFFSGVEPKSNGMQRADTQHGDICNGLTTLPDVFDNLTKLQVVYIANGLLVDLPESFSRLESLTDLELYNCSKMKEFPRELSLLPNIISLNISANKQWGAESIYDGFLTLANNEGAQKSLQLLYCVGNGLEELPAEFGKLVAIGLLDLSGNKIKKVHPMKTLQPVILRMDHNKLEEVPYGFCNMSDIETFSMSNNNIKMLPNIFSHSTYTVETIDFSYNDITGVVGAEDGTYRGLNAKMLNLQSNKFTTFPAIFATSKSKIQNLNIARNQITEFEEGCFKGENSSMITSLDFSANKINELPFEFSSKTLPYLYGADFSFNCMEQFPWAVLDCSYLTVLYVRGQRDDKGQRCLEEWPNNIGMHKGLRGLYLGSNNMGVIEDKISPFIFHLEISDNPNIVFDASDICYYIQAGAYNLYYDLDQDIRNCPALGILE